MVSIKYLTTPIVAFILLLISIIFPLFRQFWVPIEGHPDGFDILLYCILFCSSLLFGLLFLPTYLGYDIKLFESQMAVQAIHNKQWYVLLFLFPVTMIFEEILFRGIILGGLFLNIADLPLIIAILISSLIFAFFHLHTWPTFHNRKITLSFIIYAFILGLCTGFLLPDFGISGTIIFHGINVFIIYWRITRILCK